jgi:hypothetical protein
MLYIDKTKSDIKFAMEEHYKNVKCLIWKKIDAKNNLAEKRSCGIPTCSICNGKIEPIKNIPQKIYSFLNDDNFLKQLICGSPLELQSIDINFWKIIHPHFKYQDWVEIINKDEKKLNQDEKNYKSLIKKIFETLNSIIAYESWFVANKPTSNYSAYHLATYLDIRSCVYCNRTFIVSQFKKESSGKIGKLIRPQFDHWFPQEKFPLLALSFYNLIPSCSICNTSVKGRKELNLTKYTHPYEDNILDSVIFSYKHLVSVDSLKIELTGINNDSELENRISNTLKDFYIEEMYNSHHPELKDLLTIKKTYSENYLKNLKSAFPDANLTDNEIYRLIFGVELNPKDFHRRPFSKFKYDILKELKII